MLTSDVTTRATSFIVYVLVASYLGAFQLGQLALAISLFALFQRVSLVGLKAYMTRELTRSRDRTAPYVVNAAVAVVAACALSILCLLSFLRVMDYAPETAEVVLLLFIGLIPFCLSQLCEGVFQAWEKMEYIAYANAPIGIGRALAAFLLLASGYDLRFVVLAIAGSHFLLLLVEWCFLLRYITRPRLFLEFSLMRKMVKESLPFFGIQGTNAVKSSINVVLLSKLAGEATVGLYCAAIQFVVPLSLVAESVTLSVFPVMCRKFTDGLKGLQTLAENLIEFLTAITLPVIVAVYLLADGLLIWLFRSPEFLLAAGVLQIVIWIPLQRGVTAVLGRVMWASRHEGVALRIAVANTILHLILGAILISQFKLLGAAVTVILVAMINLFQHYLPVSRLFSGFNLPRLFLKPAVAAACMATYFLFDWNLPVVLTALSGAAVYSVVLCLLYIWSSGGPYRFVVRCQDLWSKA
jgi:O-antigen/teichoic acid export membrane protein